MRIPGVFLLLFVTCLLPAQELRLQRFDSATPQIDLRVYVDIAVDFYIQGDRVRYDAGGTKPPRDDGSAYSAPLPSFAPGKLNVRKMDGRGNIAVVEQPSAANAWTLKLRITDPKGGEDRYHARITWDDGSVASPPSSGGGYVQLSEMSVTASGNGALRIAGRSQNLTQTSVSLTTAGTAIISFADAPELRFRGTWRQNGNVMELSINDVFGSGAGSANGRIRLSGDRLTQIDIDGNSPTQGAFQLGFNQRGDYRDFTKPATPTTPTGPIAPTPPSKGGAIVSPNPPSSGKGGGIVSSAADSLSQTLRGTGYVEAVNGDEDAVREIIVRLDRGGRARFELSGDKSWTVLGSWRRLSDDRIEVQLEQLNSAPASGRGTLALRTSGNAQPQIRQVEMTITASRVGALDLRFTGR